MRLIDSYSLKISLLALGNATKLVEHRIHRRLIKRSEHPAVVGQGRRGEITDSQALGVPDGELAIGGRFSRLDAQPLAGVLQQLIAAAEHARERSADQDPDVAERRLRKEA